MHRRQVSAAQARRANLNGAYLSGVALNEENLLGSDLSRANDRENSGRSKTKPRPTSPAEVAPVPSVINASSFGHKPFIHLSHRGVNLAQQSSFRGGNSEQESEISAVCQLSAAWSPSCPVPFYQYRSWRRRQRRRTIQSKSCRTKFAISKSNTRPKFTACRNSSMI